ncbi:divalent-cation tolerance protein CutA [Candidatus Woesearchaeota archaeon]|nr:divalent-cation tolerance protein CutA [Candidatus Woesearchaeota archaeon]
MYPNDKRRKMIIEYIVCKNKAEAEKIVNHLLKKKLIACANIFPINSLYKWKGKLQKDKEFVLLAKTQKNKLYSLEKEVKGIHSYEIPCILQINAKANKEYERWLKNELKK